MSRCVNCDFVTHDQFKGYRGRWLCLHPYRKEISNKGEFTYPANKNPQILICETEVADYENPTNQAQILEAAQTPVWCYWEVVERAKKIQPGFDPEKQRAILWPQNVKGCSHIDSL